MAEASRYENRARESSFISLLSGWVQQGVENFFATQRILVDLAMRKNASAIDLLRGRLADSEFQPVAIVKELAGEGFSNLIEGQKLLLNLLQKESEILTTGVKEHLGGFAAPTAIAEMMQRSVDTYAEMQQDYLKIAGKQIHGRLAALRAGEEYEGESAVDFAREALEHFVVAQKKFLEMIAEETSNLTNGTTPVLSRRKKTELTELARQAADSFFEVQKKLTDIASRQVHATLKATGRAAEMIPPIPYMALPDLTREGVRTFVDAEKAMIDSITGKRVAHKAATKPTRREPARHGKRSHRPPKAAAAAV